MAAAAKTSNENASASRSTEQSDDMTDTEQVIFDAYLGKKELRDKWAREAQVHMSEYNDAKALENQYLAEAKALAAQLGLTYS